VDFVDGVAGANVAQYNVYINFDGETMNTPSLLFKSLTPSDFTTGPNGNLGVDLTIGFAEAATFTGVDVNSIAAGERFQVRTEIVKTDGVTFNSVNSTAAVTNAFGGIWNFNINATCPLSEGTFLGAYKLSYDGVYDPIANLFGAAGCQALGNDPLDLAIDVRAVAGSTTRREFDVVFFPNCGWATDVTINLDFVCTIIDAGGAKTGTTCISGEGFGSSQEGEATFNFDDDSTFSITYRDLGPGNDAGCGPTFDGLIYTLVFTKQ
jgi:hypothetical protein